MRAGFLFLILASGLSAQDGMTPLMLAAMNGGAPEVAALPDAPVRAANARGKTALHLAAEFNRDPEVLRLLLARDAELEARDAEGRTPLMLAAFRNTAPVVAFLLDAGADARARDPEGRNAYQFAAGAAGFNPRLTGSPWLEVLYRSGR